MQTEIHNTLLDISPDEWDALNQDDNPFTSYAFLSALEESASIGGETGWLPRYLLMRDNKGILARKAPLLGRIRIRLGLGQRLAAMRSGLLPQTCYCSPFFTC
jgi:hypothetical protein